MFLPLEWRNYTADGEAVPRPSSSNPGCGNVRSVELRVTGKELQLNLTTRAAADGKPLSRVGVAKSEKWMEIIPTQKTISVI